jgi:intein/homing endonuclease
MTKVHTTVVSVVPSVRQTLYFNNDEGMRMSFTQLILIKPTGENWQYLETSQASIGDNIIKINPTTGEFFETEITNITVDDGGPRTVYAISVEDNDLFVAGNMAVHNK